MPTQTSTALLEALRTILQTGQAATQDAISEALTAQGFSVNQSKISRLLRKVGAVKMSNSQKQVIYSLPKEPPPLSPDSPLSGLIVDIVRNETLIIVRTSPGSASMIARLLDFNQEDTAILATIAGDDTIFVVPKSITDIEQTLLEIKHLLQR